MRKMWRTFAVAGLAAAAAFPAAGAGPAGAAEAAPAAGDCWVIPPGGLACWRGPYSSLGTCNYWRGAYPPGSVISNCMWLNLPPAGWYFAEKVR